jgi:creatinine amidohydrolase
MRRSMMFPVAILFALVGEGAQQPPAAPPRLVGTRLEAIPWQSAESQLRADSVVVLPVGAGASEHGGHLPLGTDLRLAEYLTRRLLEEIDVVVAPTLTYHHYPALTDYPGSTSTSLNTARDLTADAARSLARYGPRRFYVLNTSPFTLPALAEAAKLIEREGLLLRYTDPRGRLESGARGVRRQPFGSHADEVETSMMLYVDASLVDMNRATRELAGESRPFVLTRRDTGRGTFSPSGVWGDATLATREKGRTFVEALLRAVRVDIDDLRRTSPGPATAPLPSTAGGQGVPRPDSSGRAECLPGDDRAIRGIGPAFSTAWLNQDPIALAGFWTPEGDMVHPDGFVERTAQTILENRTTLFMRREYRNSRHGLAIGAIRCIGGDIAVADGKWDLRGVTDEKGNMVPTVEGLLTLVLKRRGGGWGIEAYRYTMKQTLNLKQPTLLNRPGFTDINK